MAEGEKLSKNEVKRRLKAEKAAAEKAEKASKKASGEDLAKGSAPKPAGDHILDGEDISPNEYLKLRTAAVEELKKGPDHPYPHKFDVSISLTDFVAQHASTLQDGVTLSEVTVRVAGRIHAIRRSGAKLVFFDLRGEDTKIQVMAAVNFYRDGEEAFFRVNEGEINCQQNTGRVHLLAQYFSV